MGIYLYIHYIISPISPVISEDQGLPENVQKLKIKKRLQKY